jgi:hypothetical protein
VSEERTCPHCLKGNVRRWRKETQEFTHDFAERIGGTGLGKVIGHTICHDDPKWKAKQEVK